MITHKIQSQLEYIVDIHKSDRSPERKAFLIQSAFDILHKHVSQLLWVMNVCEECNVNLHLKW